MNSTESKREQSGIIALQVESKSGSRNPDPTATDQCASLLLCSRQTGKSTTTAFLALHEAIYRERALVLMLSRSLRQSQELFRKALHAYGKLPIRPASINENSLRLELANGSRIISLPGREETIRGFSGVNLLIIDEASRVSDELMTLSQRTD